MSVNSIHDALQKLPWLAELLEDSRVDEVVVREDGVVSSGRRGRLADHKKKLSGQEIRFLREAMRASSEKQSDAVRVEEHGLWRWVSMGDSLQRFGPMLSLMRMCLPRWTLEEWETKEILSAGELEVVVGALSAGEGVLVSSREPSVGSRVLAGLLGALNPKKRSLVLEGEQGMDLRGLASTCWRRSEWPEGRSGRVCMEIARRQQVIALNDPDPSFWTLLSKAVLREHGPCQCLAQVCAEVPQEALSPLLEHFGDKKGLRIRSLLGFSLLMHCEVRDGSLQSIKLYRLPEALPARASLSALSLDPVDVEAVVRRETQALPPVSEALMAEVEASLSGSSLDPLPGQGILRSSSSSSGLRAFQEGKKEAVEPPSRPSETRLKTRDKKASEASPNRHKKKPLEARPTPTTRKSIPGPGKPVDAQGRDKAPPKSVASGRAGASKRAESARRKETASAQKVSSDLASTPPARVAAPPRATAPVRRARDKDSSGKPRTSFEDRKATAKTPSIPGRSAAPPAQDVPGRPLRAKTMPEPPPADLLGSAAPVPSSTRRISKPPHVNDVTPPPAREPDIPLRLNRRLGKRPGETLAEPEQRASKPASKSSPKSLASPPESAGSSLGKGTPTGARKPGAGKAPVPKKESEKVPSAPVRHASSSSRSEQRPLSDKAEPRTPRGTPITARNEPARSNRTVQRSTSGRAGRSHQSMPAVKPSRRGNEAPKSRRTLTSGSQRAVRPGAQEGEGESRGKASIAMRRLSRFGPKIDRQSSYAPPKPRTDSSRLRTFSSPKGFEVQIGGAGGDNLASGEHFLDDADAATLQHSAEELEKFRGNVVSDTDTTTELHTNARKAGPRPPAPSEPKEQG